MRGIQALKSPFTTPSNFDLNLSTAQWENPWAPRGVNWVLIRSFWVHIGLISMPSGSGPEGGKALCDGVWRNREPRTVLGHRMDEDVYSAYRTFAEKYCDKTLRRDVYPGLPPCANTPSVWFRGMCHSRHTLKSCSAATGCSDELLPFLSSSYRLLQQSPWDENYQGV